MWELLTCPFDRQRLVVSGWQRLICSYCGRAYPVLDGIPRFLAPWNSPGWVRHLNRWARAVQRSPYTAGAIPGEDQRPAMRFRARAWEQALRELLPWNFQTRVMQLCCTGESLVHHFHWGMRFVVNPLAGFLADQGLLRWGRVRWVHAQGEWLPFGSGKFDLVVLGDALHWCERPWRLLRQVARVLKPTGLVYLECAGATAGSSVCGAAADSGWPALWVRRLSVQQLCSRIGHLGLHLVWQAPGGGSPAGVQALLAFPALIRRLGNRINLHVPLGTC